jgi:hypothetical protein
MMDASGLFEFQDLSKLALKSVKDNVADLDSAGQFDAMLSGFTGIPPETRNSLIRRVGKCLEDAGDTDTLWQANRRDLEEQMRDLELRYEDEKRELIDRYRRWAASRKINADEEFSTFEPMPEFREAIEIFNAEVSDKYMEFREEMRKISNPYTTNRNHLKNALEIHMGRRNSLFKSANKAAELLRNEADMDEIVIEADAKTSQKDCEKMIKILRRKTGVRDDAELLIPLTTVDNRPSHQATFLALLYGLSDSGVVVQAYPHALRLLSAARQGTSNMFEGPDFIQTFMDREFMQEIRHANDLIEAGFSPLRWRAAFGKPISGLVERMLSEWESSGCRKLTLPQLHSLFIGPVGTSQAVTITIPDEQRELSKKEKSNKKNKEETTFMEKFLELFKTVADEADGNADDPAAVDLLVQEEGGNE